MKGNSYLIISIFVSLFIFTSIVSADLQGVPHAFYGTVAINGASAPDGTIVSAHIEGVEVVSQTTIDGHYGICNEGCGWTSGDDFKVPNSEEGNDGKTIIFYVNGVEAAQFTFSTGHVDILDLAVTIETPPSPPSTGGGGSSGGSSGGGGGGGSVCTPSWSCDNWGPCVGGVQARDCVDVNNCKKDTNKPEESKSCLPDEETSGGGPLSICPEPGLQFCKGNDLYACSEDQTDLVLVKTCPLGCDDDHCVGESATGEGFDITGFFIGNPAALGGVIFLIIIVAAGLVLRKRK